jgi:flagellar protein FliO/FliZ
MLGALGIVVGLMLGLAWLWKKYAPRNATAAARNDVIRVVGSKILGGRRSLLLVRVRGQTLLLGVTPQRINCLTEIHEVEGDWARPAASTEDSKTSSAFQRQLGAMIDETLDD